MAFHLQMRTREMTLMLSSRNGKSTVPVASAKVTAQRAKSISHSSASNMSDVIFVTGEEYNRKTKSNIKRSCAGFAAQSRKPVLHKQIQDGSDEDLSILRLEDSQWGREKQQGGGNPRARPQSQPVLCQVT
ncbi:hypothetical protein HOLleu_25892 [Holothuria leucospilota]|uniref:Uncharacterized protein n=1 Tax=Holothuria leucospilota TaxID=206669 RepID=A0A9Q1BTG8_HOLLE|nr:hypothetical protein HOLleu_25892 [Holothuria leucospilota]